MKYRLIIQDLKESSDANVLAFLKDAEKIKPMSKRERDYCLQNRYRPESVQKLVEEFIPYIIWVAYTFGGNAKMLSVLDLINEGIIGTYDAFGKSAEGGLLTRRRVCNAIKASIKRAIAKVECENMEAFSIEECLFCENDRIDEDRIIKEADRENISMLLWDMVEKSLGARNAGIIYDYYSGNYNSLEMIGDKYGVTGSCAGQTIRKVRCLANSQVKTLI